MVTDFQEGEVTSYRRPSSDGTPGSLIELTDNLPAIIVPDIHARDFFIKNILKYILPSDFTGQEGLCVEEALEKERVNVIFVGDAIHTETSREHWEIIEEEFENGDYSGPEMTKEMVAAFSTLNLLMNLKLKFPKHFFFLKGNHENIMNTTSGCDYGFYKFADEGNMVKTFISNYYGEDILYLLDLYEKSLPFVAAGKNFVVSHAEPAGCYKKSDLIDAHLRSEVGRGLIWTRNDEVKEATAKFILNQLLDESYAENSFYFAGHRTVKGNYALRQDGRFVQIHNPHKQNITLVYNNKLFNPETDIVGVSK